MKYGTLSQDIYGIYLSTRQCVFVSCQLSLFRKQLVIVLMMVSRTKHDNLLLFADVIYWFCSDIAFPSHNAQKTGLISQYLLHINCCNRSEVEQESCYSCYAGFVLNLVNRFTDLEMLFHITIWELCSTVYMLMWEYSTQTNYVSRLHARTHAG